MLPHRVACSDHPNNHCSAQGPQPQLCNMNTWAKSFQAAKYQDACSAQRGARDFSPPAVSPRPAREVHALAGNSVRCSLATYFGLSACGKDSAVIPSGWFFPLPIRLNVQFYKWRILTPQFLTLILRAYYTLLGLRMSYLDPEGGKKELAGGKKKRSIKHVLIRLQD